MDKAPAGNVKHVFSEGCFYIFIFTINPLAHTGCCPSHVVANWLWPSYSSKVAPRVCHVLSFSFSMKVAKINCKIQVEKPTNRCKSAWFHNKFSMNPSVELSPRADNKLATQPPLQHCSLMVAGKTWSHRTIKLKLKGPQVHEIWVKLFICHQRWFQPWKDLCKSMSGPRV